MMLDSSLVPYALKVGATKRERRQMANAIYIGFKIGAVLSLVLLAIDLLTR